MPLKPLGKTTVVDMFNGAEIKYPAPKENQRLQFDFHFTKKGVWYYVNSTDDLNSTGIKRQADVAKKAGEQWRVIQVSTNLIVRRPSIQTLIL